ncbi:hypothetical protein Acid345_0945 [Candidatus Koribacter versatilis Ellin345]|uniref:Uncharacterized protein n=1 Tax=Koribacter versatilis (strain Ellin345) TaxID=204669 RepID=Q1IT52_KORVE|nr:hypothetical protein Acid345_0945 [Candidatus Koribacter versatilis Ellin345]
MPARYPQAVHWTIAFDGRKMGEVSARTPAEWSSYWRVGEQVILPSAKVPVIGKPTEEFAGFLGDPILRPLVAVSRSNFQAPDNWKPAHISENERAAIRTQFSKHFASVQNCDNESAPRKNWHYADADFHFGKSYGASTTWKLAAVHLSAYRCDGIVDDPSNDPFADQWFTIDPNGETQFLRGNLVLVDAGDYDKSGHSQLLFMIDDYNRSGYVLFYDNFAKQATFEYHFH